MKKTLLTILCFWMAASSFLFAQQTPKPNPNRNLVRVNILQINDVYEITPIAGYGLRALQCGLPVTGVVDRSKGY